VRGASGAGSPPGANASPMHQAACGSQGSAVSDDRSGTTLMSGSPASSPPGTGTTSPIGEVW